MAHIRKKGKSDSQTWVSVSEWKFATLAKMYVAFYLIL